MKKSKYTNDELKNFYHYLVLPRLIEEKMLILLRQGKISKWFSGMGQEAVSVGITLALDNDEYILPLHRNLGVFTSRNIDLFRLFCQFQGKFDGFTKGRDRSFHFGSKEHSIIGMISHLGPQMGVALGVALANELKNNNKIAVVFSGDGGASEGDFHEALNVASVWSLPIIFVVENNGYGLSTPSNEQFNCKSFKDKGVGYGMKAHSIDGNNFFDVFEKVKKIKEKIQKEGKPHLLECLTFRVRGHEESSGTKYVPENELKRWISYDPIKNFRKFLFENSKIDSSHLERIENDIRLEIDKSWSLAESSAFSKSTIKDELADVYLKYDFIKKSNIKTKELRFIDAISEAIDFSMSKHNNLIIMGQDIAEYGGVFKVTEGLLHKYGKHRVRNTPLCESVILSSALGLSVCGFKSIVEMQFADFVSTGFNAIVNNLAKSYYRWGQNSDVTVRMPTGAGVGAGPFHSQSNEAWFTHTPGLKVVYPAFPNDAKGLLISSVEDPNPVMYFEHKALYRSVRENVSENYFNIELGVANMIRSGNEVTIISYGMGVHWAISSLEKLNYRDADLIDLRTLVPLDFELITKSLKKTGKLIILQEDCHIGGFASHISSLISEECFELLDAPIFICSSIDTPVPFSKNLEDNFLAKSRFEDKLLNLIEY